MAKRYQVIATAVAARINCNKVPIIAAIAVRGEDIMKYYRIRKSSPGYWLLEESIFGCNWEIIETGTYQFCKAALRRKG